LNREVREVVMDDQEQEMEVKNEWCTTSLRKNNKNIW
jgi:hypothetical protein